MKKLTRRQKILLSFTLLTLLIGVGAIVFLISGKSGSVNNSHFSQKTQNLSQLRQQQISQIETDLKTKNFLDSNLLQELKSNYGLNATETDWKKYLQVDTKAELETRIKNVLTIISKNPTPKPQPGFPPSPILPPFNPNNPNPRPVSNPTPQPDSNNPNSPPPPSFSPQIPQTNEWEKKLAEFRSYYEKEIKPLFVKITDKENEMWFSEKKKVNFENIWSNYGNEELWKYATSKEDKKEYREILKEMHQKTKDFLHKNKNLEFLAGINLRGASKEKLRNLLSNGSLPSSTNPKVASYQNWTRLRSTGNGNCALNSISILLTGEENIDLVIRLRLNLFYEEMIKFSEKLNETVQSNLPLFHSLYIASTLLVNYRNTAPDREILAKILKRKISEIHNSSGSLNIYETEPTNPLYEPWVFYSTEFHTEPLVNLK